MLRNILYILLCWMLGLPPLQAQLHNKGATVKIQSGVIVKTTMDIQNTDGGTLQNAGTLTTAQSLSNTTGATLSGNGAYRVGGNWTNSATFTAGTSSVTFDGAQNSAATSGGGAFYNLNLDKSTGFHLVLSDAMSIGNTLDFQAASNHLLLGNFDLTVGSVTGFGADRFIVTGGTGKVLKTVTAAFIFPIGFDKTSYNPLTLTQSGTPDVLGARCLEKMLVNGTTGAPFTQKAADVSWDVSEQTPSGSNLALQFQWAGSDELPLFNRALMAALRHNGANWVAAGSGSSATGSDPYQFLIAGITAPGIFAVASQCFFCLDFSGTIKWEHDGTSGVNLTTVKLSGDQTATTTTIADGTYTLTATSGSNFTVTPTKNINKLNGLTVGDVTAVQQHVANVNLLPAPFKRIAADVNKSNTITSLDATLLNQALLGNPAALAQMTSWRFVKGSYVFPNPNVPWGFPEKINLTGVSGDVTGLDFKGIKLGDVVATFANPANFGAGNALVLNVQDQVLQTGSEVVAAFSANQLEDLAAFQFALRFDPAKLQFVEIQPWGGLPLVADNFGTYNISEGEIRAVWSQAEGAFLEEGATVFRLKFTALQSGGKLSEVLYLDDSTLLGLAYNSVLAESDVELNFLETTGTGGPVAASGLQLFQNRPNPFKGATAISFVIPKESEAQLRIFDVSGRMLAERKGQYSAGKHEELFDLEDAAGVLWYELTTPFGVLAKKMVAVER